MMTKFTSKLTQYYQISLVIVIAAILGSVFYFWKLGFIDGTKGRELLRVSYLLEQYESKRPLEEVNMLVMDENPKLAIQKLEALKKDFSLVNSSAKHEDFIPLQKSMKKAQDAASDLISFPKVGKIMSVFTEKMERFSAYIEERNWQTLSRMGQRVLKKSKGHISLESLGTIASSIENEFQQMEKITENSVLSMADKQEVISRLSALKIEIGMLAKYAKVRKQFSSAIGQLNEHTLKWITSIKPEITYQKLQAEQIGRFYTMGLLGILLLNVLIFFGGFLHNRIQSKKLQKLFEKKFKTLLTQNILEQSEEGLNETSEEFRNFTLQTSNYINKRMNFGSVFQEAMPFASVLLDSNLKVIWANKHFMNQWGIGENDISKDHLSWDYLVKMTNIAEDDPVLEALKSNIAGIYQVQVKFSQQEQARPFEMYVSPVTFNHRTRIMLFFYSLVSLQDTIQEQAKSIVTPINKSLDLLLQENYEELSRNNFGKEFEIGGIEFIQDKFITLRDRMTQKEYEFNDELEYLTASCRKLEATLAEATSEGENCAAVNRQQVNNLKVVKDSIIQLSEVGKNYQNLSARSANLLNNLFHSTDSLVFYGNSLASICVQMAEAFPKFDSIKEELKFLKNEVMDSKTKLAHGLSQFIHFKKKIGDEVMLERFTKSYERSMEEFKNLDQVTITLDKKITSLEVMLSKARMVMNGLEENLTAQVAQNPANLLAPLIEQYHQFKADPALSIDMAEQAEVEVVEQLHALYQNTKLGHQLSQSVCEVLKNHEHYAIPAVQNEQFPVDEEGQLS